jgi:uncharacterized membrane protein
MASGININQLLKKAVQTMMVLGLAAPILVIADEKASKKVPDNPSMEKCYAIVKAGKNDCGTSQHACATQSAKDSDPAEWVYLPKGTCDKLIGGNTTVIGPKT